jgi:hypothetical protein
MPIPVIRGIADGPPHRNFLAVQMASKTCDPIHNQLINNGIDRDAGILNIRDLLELDKPAAFPDNPTVASGTRGTRTKRVCRNAP